MRERGTSSLYCTFRRFRADGLNLCQCSFDKEGYLEIWKIVPEFLSLKMSRHKTTLDAFETFAMFLCPFSMM